LRQEIKITKQTIPRCYCGYSGGSSCQ